MANRWSPTRRIMRRPPVCRSKAQPEAQDNPPSLKFGLSWIFADLIHSDSTVVALTPLLNIAGTNIWIADFVDSEGSHCAIVVKSNKAPLQCEVTITMLEGFWAGVIWTADTPGWNGQPFWLTAGNFLSCSTPAGAGTLDLQVP